MIAFAVWITGLPASGKSSVTAALVPLLQSSGAIPVVLESDVLRKILTPQARYTEEERDRFYQEMALLGEMLVRQGIPVIFDATANKRSYRDAARSLVPRFLEVHIDCPLEICRTRDPKGIYARAAGDAIANLPGIQAAYERPLAAEVVADCREAPSVVASRIVNKLQELEYL
ncbi:MAG: adenylyl-sulfate kinase [Nitrospiraceae bacterium]|nr:adenylyl-sulfate kinase [Nitrospiraceae bacterium]